MRKKDKLFSAFEMNSIPEKRPFLLSRDFVFAKPTGRKVVHFSWSYLKFSRSTSPLCVSTSEQLSESGMVVLVQEAVLKIYKGSPQSRILICAPINRTCDAVMKSLNQEIPESHMFRANAAFRELDGVPVDILPS
ncbi:hypothetical protein Dsin_009425 [Dipteronia sinensis]|uniref:Uncharacterized protein n=1 Tax=Dipteronia sinensis TaxID=43782 RepID=A0AAE0EDG9_9ROSI|nr:hypothetical protein Dsin_009425 [Dipteronia sinensis]